MRTLLSVFFLMALALPAWSAEFRYELSVDGLACPYCAYGIEKKILALKGVESDSLDIKLNEGLVVFNADTDKQISEDSLKELVNDAGFTLRRLETSALGDETQDEDN